MNTVAKTYSAFGQQKRAASMYDKVLDARMRMLGDHHPATLMTMKDLAVIYHDDGLPEKAAKHPQGREMLFRISKGSA